MKIHLSLVAVVLALAVAPCCVSSSRIRGLESTKKAKDEEKKGKKEMKGKLKLSGSYCGKWSTLIAARDEVVKSEGCFVFESSGAKELFTYTQCWNRVDDDEEVFLEKAGIVILERNSREIKFFTAEVDSAQNPSQVSTSQEIGYKSRNKFVLSGAQPGLGLAYKIYLDEVDPDMLDDHACLKKKK